MQIDIRPAADTWEAVKPLYDIIWSPEIMAGLHWRDIVWAHADERVIVRENGALAPAVCHVGLYLRDITWDDKVVTVGGIGGVLTHPRARQRGFATAAMATAIAHFRRRNVGFALLFCEPHNFAFYRHLGWHEFNGEVFVEQPGGRVGFEAMTPFVYDLALAPRAGRIDLRGLPW